MYLRICEPQGPFNWLSDSLIYRLFLLHESVDTCLTVTLPDTFGKYHLQNQ